MSKANIPKNNAYFSVGSEGQLTFTEQGIVEYRSYFGKAGIDIRNIRTLKDFQRARRGASSFFDNHLTEKIKKGEQTLERQLLIAIADGNEKESSRLEKILDAKTKGMTAI